MAGTEEEADRAMAMARIAGAWKVTEFHVGDEESEEKSGADRGRGTRT